MKDIYTLLNEALAALDAAGNGKRANYDERSKLLTSAEAKLNCAKFVLGTVVKEATPFIKKNNGASHNGHIEEFRESGVERMTETDRILLTKKEAIVEATMGQLKLTEAGARNVLGLENKQPAGYDKLTEQQRKEFDFARAIGISESDAFKLANLTEIVGRDVFKEANRRF